MKKADIENLDIGDLVQVKMFRETRSGREEVCWMDGKVLDFGRSTVTVRVKQVKEIWPFRPREIRWPRK